MKRLLFTAALIIIMAAFGTFSTYGHRAALREGRIAAISVQADGDDLPGKHRSSEDEERGSSRRQGAQDMVRIFGSGVIEDGQKVGDAVFIFSEGTVSGEVEHDCVVIGGKLHLRKGAVIKGDLVTLLSSVDRDRDVVSKGSQVSIGSYETGGIGRFFKGIFSTWDFLFALVLLLFFWRKIHSLTDTFLQNPARSVLVGFFAILGFIPLIILLVISIVGILLIPFIPFLYMGGFILGFAIAGNLIGERVARLLRREMTQPLRSIIGLIVLLVALKLMLIVPLWGPLSAEMIKMLIRTGGLGLLCIIIWEASRRKKV